MHYMKYADETGAFSFTDIPSGRYEIEVAGLSAASRAVGTVVVESQNETMEFRFALCRRRVRPTPAREVPVRLDRRHHADRSRVSGAT